MQEEHGLCLEGTRRGKWTGMMNLTTLTLPDGVVIDGAVAGDKIGQSVSGKVDVNHDGISDLIIGSPNASPKQQEQCRNNNSDIWKEDMERRD